MTFFQQALDPILHPLLSLGPLATILIISLIVSLITTIIYKLATDQNHLKKLKADMKRYQKKAMAAKEEPAKAMKYQKEMMKLNGQYMRSSMKSMLYTFIPILFFFGWLGANVAFAPLAPGVDFGITSNFQPGVLGSATLMLPSNLTINDTLTKNIFNSSASWSGISGPVGTYDVSIKYSGGEEQFISILITETHDYLDPVNSIDSEVFSSIIVGNKKLIIFEGVPVLGNIPWINTFGWFGVYFLFSIVFSTSLRKGLKLA